MVGTVNVAEVVPLVCTVCACGAVNTTLIDPSISAFTRSRPDAVRCPNASAAAKRNTSVALIRLQFRRRSCPLQWSGAPNPDRTKIEKVLVPLLGFVTVTFRLIGTVIPTVSNLKSDAQP